MIRLYRPNVPPTILANNGHTWTTNLLQAVATYGSYKDIPESTKNSLLSFYRHEEIKNELLRTSHNKCAFCESQLSGGVTVEVEHFAPKSIYPDKAFDWTNLLPSCRKCNGTKSTHDTLNEPIVNPYADEPTEYLIYRCALIQANPLSPNLTKSKCTIETLGLNDERLLRPRSEVFLEVSRYLNSLENYLSELDELTQRAAKIRKAREVSNSIDILESLVSDEGKYSGFTKHLLHENPIYLKAKEIILLYLEAC